MLLTDVMTRNSAVVRPNATLTEAARKMRDFDTNNLPVTAAGRLVGLITARDITVRAIADGRDPNYTRVGETFNNQVVFCYEGDDWRSVAKAMQRLNIEAMPVLDHQNHLIGTVTLEELFTVAEGLIGDVLQAVEQTNHLAGYQGGFAPGFNGREQAIYHRELIGTPRGIFGTPNRFFGDSLGYETPFYGPSYHQQNRSIFGRNTPAYVRGAFAHDFNNVPVYATQNGWSPASQAWQQSQYSQYNGMR